MKATHCIELSTSHCNPASRPSHGERTHLFPAYRHVSMSWDFSGFTNMVCLSSQNVRKSDLEEFYNISLLVLCQIPGLRNQVLILQPLANNTVAALVPFPSKRSDLRRLCQGDGFSGQSDCFKLSKTWREAGKALHHEMYHQSSTRNHHAQPQHTSFPPISTGPLSNIRISKHNVSLCEKDDVWKSMETVHTRATWEIKRLVDPRDVGGSPSPQGNITTFGQRGLQVSP